MIKKTSKKITITVNTSKSSLINVEPKKFSDSKLVAKEVIKGNALVLDINDMPKIEAIRFIDFVTGVLYTTNGAFKKVGFKTYLVAPSQEVLEKFLTQFD